MQSKQVAIIVTKLCLSWVLFLLAYVFFAQFPVFVEPNLDHLFVAKGKALVLAALIYLTLSVSWFFITKNKMLSDKAILDITVELCLVAALMGFVSYQVFNISMCIN